MNPTRIQKVTFVPLIPLVILSLLLSACGGTATTAAPAPPTSAPVAAAECKELNLLTWEGYAEEAWRAPFEQANNVKVNVNLITSGDEEVAKLSAGGGSIYDVVSVSTDNTATIVGTGALEPIDTSKIETWSGIPKFLADRGARDGQQWSVPYTWDVNPMLYDADYFGDNPPTSWDAMWDPSLEGKVAVWDDTSTLYIAATVLGFDKPDPNAVFDMSDEQLEAVKNKLIELKPNIRKIWSSGGELIDLFANKEVVVGLGWTYVYNQLQGKGVNVKAVVNEQQGAHGWMDGWGITTGKPECKELAYKWVSYVTSAAVLKQVIGVNGYAVGNFEVVDLLDKDTVAKLHMDAPEEYAKRVVIKVDPARRDKYVETWNEVKAALTGG